MINWGNVLIVALLVMITAGIVLVTLFQLNPHDYCKQMEYETCLEEQYGY